MRPELHSEITRRLKSDYGFKEKGKWLQLGKCPDCSHKELFAKADSPWVIKCGRENNCGAEIHIKDIYRDLFESWSDRYPVTPHNPHAAADAYLQSGRGFPLARLKGLYAQEYYHDQERRIGSATVRFPLDCGSWWERIIDRPERFGKRKANFALGIPYGGHWWQLPDSPSDAGELWFTEGVFDTIALELNGKASRALLSCSNYPHEDLAKLAKACVEAGRNRPTLIWALDDGNAGKRYMRQWHERAVAEGWKSRAAYYPTHGKLKLDWNELHIRQRIDEKTLSEALYQGDLLLADSAQAKALLIYKRTERGSFHFEFNNRLFWFTYDDKAYQKARETLAKTDDLSDAEIRDQALIESGGVSELANCYPQPLYYQANTLTDEAWYYFRVSFPHKGRAIKNTFTAGQLSSGPEFKKRLLAIAPGAMFTGQTFHLDRIFQRSLFSIKTVETIDFIGYSRDHGCYVFGDIAVKGGNVVDINEEDFFEFGKLSVKSLNQSVSLAINRDRADYRTDWVEMIWDCFGAKGLISLAFWFGSLFAEQIRGTQKSYSFLEVIGEAGAGKSTLIEFLWKLVGRRDYEGFDPSKATAAARARNFAQVSGLPVVLIEADRETDTAKQKAYDWNELKTLYNGRGVRATGVKNSGNETREPPFRGSIVISQNAPVTAHDAILQRLVHINLDKSGHTAVTKAIAETLERMPIEHVSGFVLEATKREERVLEIFFDRAPAYTDQLLAMPEIKSVRIAKNHGQMMALVDAIRCVVTLSDEQHRAAHRELAAMAIERQQAINADHPYVQAFWELFEHIESIQRNTRTNQGLYEDNNINHSRDETRIAVNLLEFEEHVIRRGLRLPTDLTDLKKHLRTSRHPRFVDVKTVNSKVTGLSKKCWVFQRDQRS